MSDHHLFPFTPKKLLEATREQTNALRPDLVLLAGDYVCTDAESIRELGPILGRINAKYGVFAVLGNHDRALDPEQLICGQLRAQSIEVLIEFYRKGNVETAIGAFKKAYLDVVHQIIDSLEA
jgi:predicted MPP superfamily phosphohydrolase